MSETVLYHLEISHYNEKARWALDYKGVPHERRTPIPMLHALRALAMTRKPTLPVLKLHGKAIGDSTRIIEALEREYPEPPLYPSDRDERRRARKAAGLRGFRARSKLRLGGRSREHPGCLRGARRPVHPCLEAVSCHDTASTALLLIPSSDKLGAT